MSATESPSCQMWVDGLVGEVRHDNKLARLIDERRQLAAKVAGLDMEIAMHLGDREGARKHLREMEAQVEARKAARQAGCYFVEQGEADRARLNA